MKTIQTIALLAVSMFFWLAMGVLGGVIFILGSALIAVLITIMATPFWLLSLALLFVFSDSYAVMYSFQFLKIYALGCAFASLLLMAGVAWQDTKREFRLRRERKRCEAIMASLPDNRDSYQPVSGLRYEWLHNYGYDDPEPSGLGNYGGDGTAGQW